MCGYRRPLVSSTHPPLSHTELIALDSHLSQLPSANQYTPYVEQKSSLPKSAASYPPSLVTRLHITPLHRTCAGFSPGKTLLEKPKFTFHRALRQKITTPGISVATLFVLARDYANFPALFSSAAKAHDFSMVKTQEIPKLPDDQSFLFNYVCGKTLRDGSSNIWTSSSL